MYRELTFSKNEKILIVSPHPDDETIGTGGLLSKFGKQCDILLLTDGRKGIAPHSGLTEEETVALRKEEFKKALSHYQTGNIFNLELHDQTVKKNKKEIIKFPITDYDYIFVPNRYDRHVDHNVLFAFFKKMKRRQRSKAKLLEYEVWTPLAKPNYHIEISDVLENKKNAVNEYVTQLESHDYVKLVSSIGSYRGALTHHDCCEGYFDEELSKKREKEKRKENLIASVPTPVRKKIKRLLKR